jgi:hypothetical protein
LILHYCLISPYVLRPLIHTLKIWAAAHQLNDASGAKGPTTLSSYCYTLLAIAYLQHLGVLPNLQANVTASIPADPARENDPDTVWVSWGREQGVKAHVGFGKRPPVGWVSSVPDLTAAEAVVGFFDFYSRSTRNKAVGRMDWDNQIVSILNGGIISRSKPLNEENHAEVARRQEYLAQGMENSSITALFAQERARGIEQERFMGKGDIGIQPRNWGERRMVVQDPFLWQKVFGLRTLNDTKLILGRTARYPYLRKGQIASSGSVLVLQGVDRS